ncbi:unnamed protein product [Rangifer tarandus platyrhynchus]|uniref:Uncharacterized protein n=1 Tax=Rangifer tarandus platyrhynchus TaxID=3082113 RepID=A0AC59YTK6_RANTA
MSAPAGLSNLPPAEALWEASPSSSGGAHRTSLLPCLPPPCHRGSQPRTREVSPAIQLLRRDVHVCTFSWAFSRCWDHIPRPRAVVFSCLLYSPPCADKKCRARLGLTDP